MSCSAKRDPNETWHIQYRWTDWTGTKKKSQKRGFKTRKEAEECFVTTLWIWAVAFLVSGLLFVIQIKKLLSKMEKGEVLCTN